ncbi:hypothetical protein BDW71DRAFT_193100 [Aspergillus fruticulosus]
MAIGTTFRKDKRHRDVRGSSDSMHFDTSFGNREESLGEGACYILPVYLIRIEEYPYLYYVRVVGLSVMLWNTHVCSKEEGQNEAVLTTRT